MVVKENGIKWRALVSTQIKLLVPYNFGKFLISRVTAGFSRRTELQRGNYSVN
jgi:hypothetical protein